MLAIAICVAIAATIMFFVILHKNGKLKLQLEEEEKSSELEKTEFKEELKKYQNDIVEIKKDYSDNVRAFQSEIKQLSKSFENLLKGERRKFYYYSPTVAEQIERFHLKKFGFYFKRYINGDEFTESFHYSDIGMPTHTDNRLVFKGLGEESYIPYSGAKQEIMKYRQLNDIHKIRNAIIANISHKELKEVVNEA